MSDFLPASIDRVNPTTKKIDWQLRQRCRSRGPERGLAVAWAQPVQAEPICWTAIVRIVAVPPVA
jgi:hypothetical protein